MKKAAMVKKMYAEAKFRRDIYFAGKGSKYEQIQKAHYVGAILMLDAAGLDVGGFTFENDGNESKEK